MNLQRDRRGFVFSLDAAFGLLVVIIMIAGIASVGGSEQTYRQHGYLQLERYANDALEVFQATGTIDSIVEYVNRGDLGNAENIAMTEFREILPIEIQFKLVIGDNRLTVFPNKAAGWTSAFYAAKELGVAARIKTFSGENIRFEPITLYVWRGAEVG